VELASLTKRFLARDTIIHGLDAMEERKRLWILIGTAVWLSLTAWVAYANTGTVFETGALDVGAFLVHFFRFFSLGMLCGAILFWWFSRRR